MGRLRVPVTQHDHILGPPNATVTLVEYGDYLMSGLWRGLSGREPRIAALQSETALRVQALSIDSGSPSCGAGRRERGIRGAHGRFWEMHAAIYENQDRLGLPLLFALARALGFSEVELRDALVSESGDAEPR